MEKAVLLRVLASCVKLADKASCIIRDVYASKDLDIVDKGVNDFQSKADRDAQCCIVGSLTKSFPGLKIIGEEGQLDASSVTAYSELDPMVMSKTCPAAYESTSLSDIVVWVDPLDGTKEYTEGELQYVTVLIGIAVNRLPVAGVVAQPFYSKDESAKNAQGKTDPTKTESRIIWSLDQLGIFGMEPKRLPDPTPFLDQPSTVDPLANVITTTRSHPSANLKSALNACNPTSIVRAGGCGYKILLLLEGKAHLYLFPSPGTKRWDTCAPEAVLRTFGGRLTSMFGDQYDYGDVKDPMNCDGIMATASADWLSHYAKRMPPEALNFAGSSRCK